MATAQAAARSGFEADRIGFAFAAGYQAALRALLPTLKAGAIACLCATEATGAHPRAIATTLRDGVLSGEKRWSTMAPMADVLLVVAKTGDDEAAGRPQLRLVAVSRADAGERLHVVTMPETPFIPEIPHAELRFDDVPIAPENVLPGDGYSSYVKPFRTVEDLHVHAALLGHLVALARRREWPRTLLEALVQTLVSVCALAAEDARDPSIHVAVGGTLAATTRVLAECDSLFATPVTNLANLANEAKESDDQERTRFLRDRPLLGIAGRARAERLDAAWRALAVDRASPRI